jgi:signal peptide peptidase SppA
MLNDYRQIISQLRNSCWYIVPESLETILEIVNMRLNGVAFSDEEIRLRLSEAENGDRDASRVEVGGGVGIIPLYGPIYPKANLMTALSGATSMEQFSADLDSLMRNDDVENIILDIDSPGGVDSMIPETAQKIREAREVKPIHAVANTMAGSAAYYLASQASSFYASPSGKVGSIGAYIVHEDNSAADEKEGRKITFISSGKYKTAGNEHEPLSLDARDYIQTLVNESHEQFVQDVAAGRGVSVDSVREYADGRIFRADTATKMGMIDGVKSLNDLAGDLLIQGQPQVRGTLSAIAAKHQKALEVANKAGIVINNSNSIVPKEGRMNEQELRQLLGLDADADLTTAIQRLMNTESNLRSRLQLGEDDDLVEAVTELHEEVTPIREVQTEASKQAAFAQQFPEEYARMQALEDRTKSEDAKMFAAQYERFSKKDGDKEVKSTQGFPMVTLNKIEECHQAISDRAFSHTMLENLLSLIASQGIVDFSEKGSSRQSEAQLNSDPIQRFSDRITSLMVDDSISDPRQATRLAIQKWPTEYEEYRDAQARKTNTTG